MTVQIPSLMSVNFHLIKPCNERCRYCFATFRDVNGRLSNDDAERLIGKLAEAGMKKITFVGGEPTLHPALPALIRRAHAAGVVTAIVSNGARLSGVVEECGAAIGWVGLSVDSAREEVQKALGRGRGDYVARSRMLFAELKRQGVRTKLNTVVTALNCDEDMSELIRSLLPDRWKVFQVLPIAGQNDGTVEPLLITDSQFASFVGRHAGLARDGLAPVVEDNEAMKGSYLMIDPLGRFFDNVDGRLTYSAPILDVGVATALGQVRFNLVKLVARGGVYQW